MKMARPMIPAPTPGLVPKTPMGQAASLPGLPQPAQGTQSMGMPAARPWQPGIDVPQTPGYTPSQAPRTPGVSIGRNGLPELPPMRPMGRGFGRAMPPGMEGVPPPMTGGGMRKPMPFPIPPPGMQRMGSRPMPGVSIGRNGLPEGSGVTPMRLASMDRIRAMRAGAGTGGPMPSAFGGGNPRRAFNEGGTVYGDTLPIRKPKKGRAWWETGIDIPLLYLQGLGELPQNAYEGFDVSTWGRPDDRRDPIPGTYDPAIDIPKPKPPSEVIDDRKPDPVPLPPPDQPVVDPNADEIQRLIDSIINSDPREPLFTVTARKRLRELGVDPTQYHPDRSQVDTGTRRADGGRIKQKRGRRVRGPGDGRSDSVPARVGKEPAALSDGEYVFPADVVSALGRGSTDAGSDVLDSMVGNVRQAHASRMEVLPPPRKGRGGKFLGGLFGGDEETKVEPKLPDWLKPFVPAFQGAGQAIFNMNPADTVAGFSPDQLAGFDALRQIAFNDPTGYFDTADLAGRAGERGLDRMDEAADRARDMIGTNIDYSRDAAGRTNDLASGALDYTRGVADRTNDLAGGALDYTRNAADRADRYGASGYERAVGAAGDANVTTARGLRTLGKAGQEFTTSEAMQRMNPYEDIVLDNTLRDFDRGVGIRRNETANDRARRGAFGIRRDLAEVEEDRAVNEERGDLISGVRQKGFESSRDQFNSDMDRLGRTGVAELGASKNYLDAGNLASGSAFRYGDDIRGGADLVGRGFDRSIGAGLNAGQFVGQGFDRSIGAGLSGDRMVTDAYGRGIGGNMDLAGIGSSEINGAGQILNNAGNVRDTAIGGANLVGGIGDRYRALQQEYINSPFAQFDRMNNVFTGSPTGQTTRTGGGSPFSQIAGAGLSLASLFMADGGMVEKPKRGRRRGKGKRRYADGGSVTTEGDGRQSFAQVVYDAFLAGDGDPEELSTQYEQLTGQPLPMRFFGAGKAGGTTGEGPMPAMPGRQPMNTLRPGQPLDLPGVPPPHGMPSIAGGSPAGLPLPDMLRAEEDMPPEMMGAGGPPAHVRSAQEQGAATGQGWLDAIGQYANDIWTGKFTRPDDEAAAAVGQTPTSVGLGIPPPVRDPTTATGRIPPMRNREIPLPPDLARLSNRGPRAEERAIAAATSPPGASPAAPAMAAPAEPSRRSLADRIKGILDTGSPATATAAGEPEEEMSRMDRAMDNPLLHLGLNMMASRRNGLLPALGEAGVATAQTMSGRRRERRADAREKRQEQRDREAAERARKSLELQGLGIETSAEDRDLSRADLKADRDARLEESRLDREFRRGESAADRELRKRDLDSLDQYRKRAESKEDMGLFVNKELVKSLTEEMKDPLTEESRRNEIMMILAGMAANKVPELPAGAVLQ
jgi:hypothetical protein